VHCNCYGLRYLILYLLFPVSLWERYWQRCLFGYEDINQLEIQILLPINLCHEYRTFRSISVLNVQAVIIGVLSFHATVLLQTLVLVRTSIHLPANERKSRIMASISHSTGTDKRDRQCLKDKSMYIRQCFTNLDCKVEVVLCLNITSFVEVKLHAFCPSELWCVAWWI
jgi:hypothetical protein